jgi:tetratricopeptide (TPR) repeat protein
MTRNQAIFLSYASQDADTARRICEALREAGLEVWFDQSELRGGDAWDQSIRKQIKECALFIPVISASTDSRPEGYFRLEWKLAVDRSHLMADDQPFFVPVILGDTPEPTARVPEKFRERQWTRLTEDVAIKTFAERIANVQAGRASSSKNASMSPSDGESGESRETRNSAALAGDDRSTGVSAPNQLSPQVVVTRRRTMIGGAAFLVAGATGLAVWQPWKPSSTSGNATGKRPDDPDLRRAIELIESTTSARSDVLLAEELVKGVLERRPTDVDATVVMARVQTYILHRGWDNSEERFASAKRFSERALLLAPDNPDAMGAMVAYMYRRQVELPRAAVIARDAIARAPDNPSHYRALATVVSEIPGLSEDDVMTAVKQMVDRFPKDALVQYDAGLIARSRDRMEDAERHFDLAIKHGPIANAIIAQSWIKLWFRKDRPGTKALLDSLPAGMRTTDRAVLSQVVYGIAARDFDFASAALASFPDPWMNDVFYTGPTSLLGGEVLLLQGKAELAKIRFAEAQAQLAGRKPVMTRFFNTVWLDSWMLMRLGKMDEARARNLLVYQELQRPFRVVGGGAWIFSHIARNLLLGEREKALALIREAAVRPNIKTYLRNAMELDPRMAPFRNDNEIVAILAEQKSNP